MRCKSYITSQASRDFVASWHFPSPSFSFFFFSYKSLSRSCCHYFLNQRGVLDFYEEHQRRFHFTSTKTSPFVRPCHKYSNSDSHQPQQWPHPRNEILNAKGCLRISISWPATRNRHNWRDIREEKKKFFSYEATRDLFDNYPRITPIPWMITVTGIEQWNASSMDNTNYPISAKLWAIQRRGDSNVATWELYLIFYLI